MTLSVYKIVLEVEVHLVDDLPEHDPRKVADQLADLLMLNPSIEGVQVDFERQSLPGL